MKILYVNKFFYRKGGAENVFLDTASYLRGEGHDISFFSMQHPKNLPSEYSKFFVSQVDYESHSPIEKIRGASKFLYSIEAKEKLEELIKENRPQLAHLHNIYHQLSPSILHVLKKHKIPIVMTLHDYKMVCGSYYMLAQNTICEACSGGKYYQCFLKSCAKNSRIKSALTTAEMYLHHKILKIYDLVDIFISPSEFLKNKLSSMGFNNRVEYIPNFIDSRDIKPTFFTENGAIIYFGRLSNEKGLKTLIQAVSELNLELKIIGDGPVREELLNFKDSLKAKNVKFLGYKTGSDLSKEIASSMFVVLPSEWYENNPLSVVEAFAHGKPVIGSRIGGIPELVLDNETGSTFNPGDILDLKTKITNLASKPNEINRMGVNARSLVETKLCPESHYQKLLKLYSELLEGEKNEKNI